jgi:2-amino-4-hydroxy-6-hydroxymethyldihydropteridine diphosphokinase
MHKAVLLIGGNLGDRKALIFRAKQMLETHIGACIQHSSIYESEAWGFQAESNFYNQILILETELSAADILEIALKIESDLGRKRESNSYASRSMDIDILFYDEQIIHQENLIIPHPRLHLRRFTLLPLVEILADFVHPEIKKTLGELLDSCDDDLKTKKLEN